MNFKMFAFKSNFVLLILFFQGYSCQRRIQAGMAVSANSGKRYVVYFLKASISPKHYSGWLCGGAIITKSLIVTSAACVSDVSHLYAIAGYEKYVKADAIQSDQCIKEKKKKVIQICTPNGYQFSYDESYKWAHIDIAVVKVESPYNFDDTTYKTVCSYIPTAISINYDPKYQSPGVDAIALGWGHKTKYREEMDDTDFNMESLQYAPTRIINKGLCKPEYMGYEGMNFTIDKYMICTNEEGNLDDKGAIIKMPTPDAQGCDMSDKSQTEKRTQLKGPSDEETTTEPDCDVDKTGAEEDIPLVSRKLNNRANITINGTSEEFNNQSSKIYNSFVDTNNTFNSSLMNKISRTAKKGRSYLKTRRYGICQNDHGGPLVTWIGAHEVLIGVASAFKITEELDCVGPYLFTSTQCNGAFLSCIALTDTANMGSRRGEACANFTEETGLTISQTNISWLNHPDGPAENEKNMSMHSSPANIDTNTTSNLKNSDEGKNVHLQNNGSSILVNINFTDTLENKTTTKVANVRLSTATSTDSSNKAKESASVMLTSATSTTLSNAFADLTENNNHSNSESSKPLSKSSKSKIDNTLTTILMKNTAFYIGNTTTATNLDSLTTNPIENARLENTTNLLADTTPKSLENATIQANSNLTTSD